MAEERKVSWEETGSADGGQGSRAFSRPMREDSPAARMTPAKPGERDMLRKIAESGDKVSAWNQLRVGRMSPQLSAAVSAAVWLCCLEPTQMRQ